jgi:mono/diheme cytochrome c family protein
MRFPSLYVALLSTSLVVSAAAGCGGGTPEPTTPPPPAPSASASAGPATAAPAIVVPAVWSNDMTKEQQVAFMKKNVVGRMGKVFQGHDGAKYADFSCKTCHGPEYKNPKEFLPKLTFKDGKMTAFAEKPDMAKFMASNVTPEMAQAMGLKPFDPQTHQGFGCNGCHTVDMK